MQYGGEHYFGDEHRWFIGTVINVNDPHQLGRVQVRIHGVHSNDLVAVPDDDLPWATVMLPTTQGGVSGVGMLPRVLPSALVFGIFLDGKTSQSPMVLGHLNKYETPATTQLDRAATRGEPIPNIGTDGVNISESTVRQYEQSSGNVDAKRLLIMKFFIEDAGLTPIQAAGITGNLEGENSTFDPGRPSEFAGENSTGLAQWNPAAAAGNRLGNLKGFAAHNSLEWNDFFTQLKFIMHELRGSAANGPGASSESGAYTKLLNTTKFEGGVDLLNSTWVICRYYERPDDAAGKVKKREEYARRAYEQYQDAISTAQPTGPF